jgi:hypothetical protein
MSGCHFYQRLAYEGYAFDHIAEFYFCLGLKQAWRW